MRKSFGIACAVTALVLFSVPTQVLAADEAVFPRGQGFYFSIPKLVSLIAVYLCWVATCRWVDEDAGEVGLPAQTWNLMIFGAGLLGLIVVWLLPLFWLSLCLLLVLYCTISLTYVNLRNQRVPADERVLTKRHFKKLAQEYLRLRLGTGDDEGLRGVPVQFIGKSQKGAEDPGRVARVATSKGYKAAKEMVYEAIQRRATDIHLEPTKEELTVRFRVDGILHATDPFGRSMGDAVINIFKVLADLDI